MVDIYARFSEKGGSSWTSFCQIDFTKAWADDHMIIFQKFQTTSQQPSMFSLKKFFQNLKNKNWKKVKTKSPQNQSTNWTESPLSMTGNPPFLAPVFWTELRPLVSKSTAGPPSPEIAKRVWWFRWFTVINPMFRDDINGFASDFFTTCCLSSIW